MRPRTLPLATASIIMGSALAAAVGVFSWLVALLCLLTAILLQILSNLANDYGDSVNGADSGERLGPKRAVQSGLIAAADMRRAVLLCALATAASGLALLWFAFGTEGFLMALLFAALGGAAIAAAVTYTAGRSPYGYAGFGDLAVLIFFGWVGVIGSYFVQTTTIDLLLLLPATSCGLLSVAVLNVNNIRDLDSDRAAGKRSIPVRLGLERAKLYHWLLLIGSVLFALLYVVLTFASAWDLLFLLAVPLLIRNGLAISRAQELPALNPWLKQMSLATLAFVGLFSAGQLISAMLV